jgi:hypothetical protein
MLGGDEEECEVGGLAHGLRVNAGSRTHSANESKLDAIVCDEDASVGLGFRSFSFVGQHVAVGVGHLEHRGGASRSGIEGEVCD